MLRYFLLIACLGSSSARPDCTGKSCASGCNTTACGQGCTGNKCANLCDNVQCGSYCTGLKCAKKCDDYMCGSACVGDNCAEECTGIACGRMCIGKDCALNCNDDTNNQCGGECMHFEGETCTTNTDAVTYTMNKPCAEGSTPETQCYLKNHPAVWQILRYGSNATWPTSYIGEQCHYHEDACKTNDNNAYPLICRMPIQECKASKSDTPYTQQMCTKSRKCGLCMGICTSNDDCIGNLECTTLNSTKDGIPGCSLQTLDNNIVLGYGYCSLPTPGSDTDTNKTGIIVGLSFVGIFALALGVLVVRCRSGQCNDWREKFNLKPRAGFSEVRTFVM